MEKTRIREFICEWCKVTIRKFSKTNSFLKNPKSPPRRFCSKSCSNKFRHAAGNLKSSGEDNPMFGRTIFDVWIEKYGIDEANCMKDEYIKKIAALTAGDNNPMYGKRHSEEARLKMSIIRKGKSFDELWGKEKARLYKQNLKIAMSGARNPMFGKISSGGRSLRGYYKGLYFRSLLEYSFMKHLEAQGLNLHEDVEYETVRIPLDENHTYCTDFYLPSQKKVYEIKPQRLTTTKINQKKFDIAKNYLLIQGIEFIVATENDFKKIEFNEAAQDNDIVFDERTFSYFKGKQ
jgi:hypothetical protein